MPLSWGFALWSGIDSITRAKRCRVPNKEGKVEQGSGSGTKHGGKTRLRKQNFDLDQKVPEKQKEKGFEMETPGPRLGKERAEIKRAGFR